MREDRRSKRRMKKRGEVTLSLQNQRILNQQRWRISFLKLHLQFFKCNIETQKKNLKLSFSTLPLFLRSLLVHPLELDLLATTRRTPSSLHHLVRPD